MKIATHLLIDDLISRTKEYLNRAKQYKAMPLTDLNRKASPETWSVLECIEHLNRYGDFYIPEISRRMQSAPQGQANDIFKSGILGNYFAESMLPKDKLNKMSTFKSMNPAGSQLDKSVLDKFITQQQQMLGLLEQARTVNLTKTKTGISISRFIKLRLGDTFRVVIYHNNRHIVQADKALKVE